MAHARWSRQGRARAVGGRVDAPEPRRRLLVDRGDLIVPVDAVRMGDATVGSVLRSMHSVGLDDVAGDVDEAAWRLQRALRPPATPVTGLLDALLWRVPRTRSSFAAALRAALLRTLLGAAACAVVVGALVVLPWYGGALRFDDSLTATTVVLVAGVAALVLATTLLLAVVERVAIDSRLPARAVAAGVVGVACGCVPSIAVWQIAPTFASLHPWLAAPSAAAVACAVVALVLQDALPGSARRRRSHPPQSMPRATPAERLEALVHVAEARLAALDAAQRHDLRAAVAAGVHAMHHRGDVDDRTRDLLLAGEPDEGFDALPTVLLAIDATAAVPLGSDVPWRSLAVMLEPGEPAVQLVQAVAPTIVDVRGVERAAGRPLVPRSPARAQEIAAHVDPVALARVPVLDRGAGTWSRVLARVWPALPWLAFGGTAWIALVTSVAPAAEQLVDGDAPVALWVLTALGLVVAIGWLVVLEVVEAVQRHRSRAGLLSWQGLALVAAVALIATIGTTHVSQQRAWLVACIVVALVAVVLRRVAWWRGAAPTWMWRTVHEWPLRPRTAARLETDRRRLADAVRAADPAAFDRMRSRLAALALVPIARGTLDAAALDDPAA